MRFGKRLAEVTQGGKASEPYVSYKELKHIVSRISGVIGDLCGRSSPTDDAGNSSADEGGHMAPLGLGGGGASSSRGPGSGLEAPGGTAPAAGLAAVLGSPAGRKLEAQQQEFFRRVDSDLSSTKTYVQGTLAALEAAVGEWQASAIAAGLLFTPQQLEEVSAHLPFAVQSKQVLVEWLVGLQAAPRLQESARGLIEKYSSIASTVNGLLQYLEVNLTAVRKIFKKFEKKVPAEFRLQSTRDYKAHHELMTQPLQALLGTAMQMQRLVAAIATSGSGAGPFLAISQVGPESLALLSWLRGPAGLEDILGTAPAARIDVYAKPNVEPAAPPPPAAAAARSRPVCPVPNSVPEKQTAIGAGAATPGASVGRMEAKPSGAAGSSFQWSGALPGNPAAGSVRPSGASVGAGPAVGGYPMQAGVSGGKMGRQHTNSAAPKAAGVCEDLGPEAAEQDAAGKGRRGGRGGRGQGTGRGRRQTGAQPAQGGFAPGHARGHPGVAQPAATPLQLYPQVPAYFGSVRPGQGFKGAGVGAGGAGAAQNAAKGAAPSGAVGSVAACSFGPCGGKGGSQAPAFVGPRHFGGPGAAFQGQPPQGMQQAWDPHFVAAMMPMFWQPGGGITPMDVQRQSNVGSPSTSW